MSNSDTVALSRLVTYRLLPSGEAVTPMPPSCTGSDAGDFALSVPSAATSNSPIEALGFSADT